MLSVRRVSGCMPEAECCHRAEKAERNGNSSGPFKSGTALCHMLAMDMRTFHCQLSVSCDKIRESRIAAGNPLRKLRSRYDYCSC